MESLVTTVTAAEPIRNPPTPSKLEGMQITRSGRSWWAVRYQSGRVINEWATLQFTKLFTPLGPAPTSRWEDISKQNINGLYLFCPNGRVGALEGDYEYFQLKVGGAHAVFSFGNRPVKVKDKHIRAHIIGRVVGENGECECYAWEYQETPYSTFFCPRCGGCGRKRKSCPGCGSQELRRDPLILFRDNVTNMAYEQIGTISLGHHTGIR